MQSVGGGGGSVPPVGLAGEGSRQQATRRRTGRAGMAGGLGLEPRLHGSKGRRAADYPIPHPRRRTRAAGALAARAPAASLGPYADEGTRRDTDGGITPPPGPSRRPPYAAVGYEDVASARDRSQ